MNMAALSRKIRSISLPPRSHPSTARVEEELGKLKSWESTGEFSSSGSISLGLSGLEKLYLCLDDLLNMCSTQQVLSGHSNVQHVNELLDVSVMILDICGMTRDLVSQIKEDIRELESAIRRRKGDSSIEASIADYANLRKKMKKNARRLITRLRQMDNEIVSSAPLLDRDQHFSAVIRALREVNASSIAVFRSVLMFLSGPITGQARWSLISRLMLKGAVETDPKPVVVNEFEDVSAALRSVCLKGPDAETMHNLLKGFGELEIGVGGIENGIERMYRRFVQTRATLLNIISQ